MSDGLSDYLRDQKPIVPRTNGEMFDAILDGLETMVTQVVCREPIRIRVINPPPPYFWLGAQAEATNG